MLNQSSEDVANLDITDVCYVRSRRAWPWGARTFYEVVGTRGHKLEVLATTRAVPSESEEAATVRDQLIRRLFREGWIPTREPLFVGEVVIGIYVRRIRRAKP